MKRTLVLAAGALAVAALIGLSSLRQPARAATRGGDRPSEALADMRESLRPVARPAAGFRLSSDPGRVLRHATRLTHRITMRMKPMDGAPAAEPHGVAFTLAGTLETVSYPNDSSDLLLGVRFTDVALTVAQPTDATRAVEEHLRREALVAVTPSGVVQQFHFATDMSREAANLVKALVLGAQVVLPPEPRDAWTSVEEDMTGRYEAAYAATFGEADDRTFATLTKSKRAYRRVHAFGTGAGAAATPSGSTTAILDMTDGHVRDVAVDESIALAGRGLLQEIDVTTRGTMTLSDTLRVEPSPLDAVLARRRAMRASPPAQAEGTAEAAAEARAKRQREIAEGHSVHGLMAALSGLAGAQRMNTRAAWEAVERLTALLATDPSALAETVALVRSGTLPPEVVNHALEAMGCAGAQAELVAFIDDAALHPSSRLSALVSLSSVPHPSEATEAALRAMTDRRDELELGPNAALILGALAARSERATEAIDFLVGREESFRATGHVPVWLGALGNSAHPSALPAIARHLTNRDDESRRAAVGALARMEASDLDAVLARFAAQDPSVGVRVEALRGMAARPRCDALDAAARQALAATNPLDVRQAAAEYFRGHGEAVAQSLIENR